MTCGSRIALLRDKRRLKQEELAHVLGISRASLSHYEQNRREPDHETLIRIADFFQVSIDYLVGRIGELENAEMMSFLHASGSASVTPLAD